MRSATIILVCHKHSTKQKITTCTRVNVAVVTTNIGCHQEHWSEAQKNKTATRGHQQQHRRGKSFAQYGIGDKHASGRGNSHTQPREALTGKGYTLKTRVNLAPLPLSTSTATRMTRIMGGHKCNQNRTWVVDMGGYLVFGSNPGFCLQGLQEIVLV